MQWLQMKVNLLLKTLWLNFMIQLYVLAARLAVLAAS